MKHILELIDPISSEAQTLQSALLHCSSYVRVAAVSELGRRVAPNMAVPILLKALSNDDSAVRSLAATSLAQLRGRAAVPALTALLNIEKDEEVRSDAILALDFIGHKSVVPALIKSLKDKKKRIRLQAAQALSKLDAQAATPAFLKFLRDKEENVRSIAAQNLGRSSGRSVVEALVAALKNGTTGLSRRSFGGKALEIVIIEALRSLGDPAAIPELEEALKINKRYGKHIADAAATALRELGKKM